MQRVLGAGSYAGASIGAAIDVEVTNADDVCQLRGLGYQVGGAGTPFGGPFVEGGVIGGQGYRGLFGGGGIGGGTPGAAFGFITHTSDYP